MGGRFSYSCLLPFLKALLLMKRHLPNALTCANLICGVLAIIYALFFSFEWALGFIILGAVFDFFDGMVARLLQVQSPIGKELDSLADVVTFGVAPSAMLLTLQGGLPHDFINERHDWLFYFPLIIAPFSALRLAKFNVDTRQSNSFIGLPTPANALFWASLVVALSTVDFGVLEIWQQILIYLLLWSGIVFSCWLLVSEVPMFALKFKDFSWGSNRLRYAFLLLSLVLILGAALVGLNLLGLSASILLYILLSLVTGRQAVSA